MRRPRSIRALAESDARFDVSTGARSSVPASTVSHDPSLPPESFSTVRAHRAKQSEHFVLRAAPWLVIALIVPVLVVAFHPRELDHDRRLNPAAETAIGIITLRGTLDEYSHQHGGHYPTELGVLFAPDEHGNSYLEGKVPPQDGWHRDYQFDPPSREHPEGRVWSFGKDGEPGGEGDDADIDEYDLDLRPR
jgi:general secretion pathway protein G